jgi:hypothetical protein
MWLRWLRLGPPVAVPIGLITIHGITSKGTVRVRIDRFE